MAFFYDMRLRKLVLLILILLSGILYYFYSAEGAKTSLVVNKVIDGDTLDTSFGRVRLLGINTPEKEQPFYPEARDYLKQFEGRQLGFEIREKDKYGRFLAYVFDGGELVNKNILQRGLANLYYYGEDEYYSEMKKAEEGARKNEIGIWKKSNNSLCIEMTDFKPIDTGSEKEVLELKNNCNFSLKIIIKDDANHIYNEEINSSSVLRKELQNIFNDDGDSLFVRDENGLVLFYRY